MGVCYSCVDNASVEVIEGVSGRWVHCSEDTSSVLGYGEMIRIGDCLPGTAQYA